MQHEHGQNLRQKISLANFLIRSTLSPRAEFVRYQKERQNGLEITENRRSAGRHGNQHVCVRCPEVTGSDRLGFSEVDLRA